MTSVWTPLRRRARRDQRGQALVEFALVAPLFIMLVAGVIQFAVALNFWFDLQRLANQGARSAAVNCGAGDNQCGPESTLEASLERLKVSRGNTPDAVICYVPPLSGAGNSAAVGDAVRVTLIDDYQFVPIIRIGSIELRAVATMRLEQTPTSSALPPATTACP